MYVADNLRDSRPIRQIMLPVRRSPDQETGQAPAQIAQGQAGYPSRLLALSDPPAVLWVRGRAPADGVPAVAMVGARAASGEGCTRARVLARELAEKGIVIISGGAFGIDAAAHEGALAAAAAPTFGILGCGVDVTYPDRHGPLFARIAATGGLLSEYQPGTPPRAGQFPARNRIIAALGDAVVVVEAAYRSGALITANLARWLGRPVLAVPGSCGTDRLLQRGQAWPVTSTADVEEALAGRQPAVAQEPEPPSGTVGALVAALREGAATPAVLSRRIGLPLPAVMAALVEAELDGWLFRIPGNQYEVIRRGC
jgi:DNA processing protein